MYQGHPIGMEARYDHPQCHQEALGLERDTPSHSASSHSFSNP
jgi:hypothetical protein